MKQRAFILRLPAGEGQELSWCAFDGEGGHHIGRGDLRSAAARAKGLPLTVLMPAQTVLLTQAAAPTANRQRLIRLVPFALEEQLAEDVDKLHFALASSRQDHHIGVAVVAHDELKGVMEFLVEAELNPRSVTSELFMVPCHEGAWSVLLEDGQALVRTGREQGYSVDPGQLQTLLMMAMKANEQAPNTLYVYDARNEEQGSFLWAHETIPAKVRTLDSALESMALDGLQHPINLLQGHYSRSEQLGKWLKPWRAAAALLAGWLVLEGVMGVVSLNAMEGREAQLYSEIEAVYRKTFPQAKRVVNPRLQMEQKLNEMQGGGDTDDFVELMAASGPLLAKVKELQIQSMNYKTGSLALDLHLKDLTSLDELKAALDRQGLIVDIKSATSQAERVESRIEIRKGAA